MLRHYLLLATKVLLRRKFFTFISLFGTAFTLVVLTVVVAIADHAFAPAAPETRQARTLGVSHATMFGPRNRTNSSPGFKLLDTYARGLPGVETLSIFSDVSTAYSFVDGQKVEVAIKKTDGEFWQILAFTFLDGRPYSAEEVAHAAPVVVLTRSARDRLLKPDAATGASVEIDGQRFRVVGVVEDVSAMRLVPYADAWVPYTTNKTDAYRGEFIGGFQALALAQSPDAFPAIQAEFNSRLRRAELPGAPGDFQTVVAPLETKMEGFARMLPISDATSENSQLSHLLVWTSGFGLLFALLPAVNLVNINVSRILERSSEIGVRKAFGASSITLVMQFVIENVLLTLVGAALAFVLSWFVLRGINDSGLIPHAALTLNVHVFAWGVGLAVAFGLLSGVYPAWRMSRLRPVEALKGTVR